MKNFLVIVMVLSFHLPVSPEGIPQKACMGKTAELPCNFTVAKDSMNMFAMYMQKAVAGTDEVVYEYFLGKEITTNQNEKYKNRSEKAMNNFIVYLKAINTEDNGHYKCIILQTTVNGLMKVHESSIDLEVYAHYSEPRVFLQLNAIIQHGDFVNLTCVSKGGYPQADILWTVTSGNVTLKVIQRNNTTSYGKSNKSYYLSSTAMIHFTEDAIITCSIQHSTLDEIKTSVNYSLNVSPPEPDETSTAVCIALSLLPFLLISLLILLLWKKCCYKKSYYFPVTRKNMQPITVTAGVGDETAREIETTEKSDTAEYMELEMPLKLDTVPA